MFCIIYKIYIGCVLCFYLFCYFILILKKSKLNKDIEVNYKF